MPLSKMLQYVRHGDPCQVLKLVEKAVADNPGPREVLVRWVASPIDPIDIAKISGVHYDHVELPHTGGTEGLGIVEKIGSGVQKLLVGDHVIPSTVQLPTWMNYNIVNCDDIRPIDKKIKLEFAATLLINPPTAYCLLKGFVQLSKGDYIIQNCANSAVGQYIIQLAKVWGFQTINLVRDRPEIEKVIPLLKQYGADIVLTEQEFQKNRKDIVKNLKNPIKLALNAAGGQSALLVSSSLDHGGTIITYGEMSGQPSQFSTASFIFKDIKAVGFAWQNFLENPRNESKCDEIFTQLQELYRQQHLFPPEMEKWGFQDYKKAIERAVEGGHVKQFLIPDTVL